MNNRKRRLIKKIREKIRLKEPVTNEELLFLEEIKKKKKNPEPELR